MIIKKMKLVNIRSYKEQTIDFPLGKTLFEGDIGSGKSTILMALEFGLFGLGSEKAGSLLRANESEGLVGVVFESGGKEYVVTRHLLKKGKAFNQDNCVLKTADGNAKQYSATEIKGKILEILDFNEPLDPKANSVIYRYAIYTPQEEMKLILSLRPDHRLQTLRKAFRLEDYKTAVENSKNLALEVKGKSKEFAAMASDMDEIKERISELQSEIAQKKSELVEFQRDRERKGEDVEEQKRKRDDFRARQLALKGEASKVDALVKLIDDKKKEIWMAKSQTQSLQTRIETVEPKIAELDKIENPSEQSQQGLRDEISKLDTELKELRANETRINLKFNDYKTILEKSVCPTCDRPIEAHDFSERVLHKQTELATAKQGVEQCDQRLQSSRKLLDFKILYDQAQPRLEDLQRNLSEYRENLKIWQNKLEEASKAQDNANRELAGVKESAQKLEQVDSEIRAIELGITKFEDELKEINDKLSSGSSDIKNWEMQVTENEHTVQKKLEKKARSDKLNEYLIWLQDYFVSTLETVEKQVMTNINQEFDSQFQKWFGMLVDDPGKQAKVDEEFTPIIQQDGLDQDVSYLSGGEKTSVALAYRLALNTIVRKVSTGMHSNLLILDEPTDGFSKDQLAKVREILDEIQSPQIILVSHERELESFADQIYRVTKTHGESSISAVR
jgi:DNA repair protein SbcC/Rad50